MRMRASGRAGERGGRRLIHDNHTNSNDNDIHHHLNIDNNDNNKYDNGNHNTTSIR